MSNLEAPPMSAVLVGLLEAGGGGGGGSGVGAVGPKLGQSRWALINGIWGSIPTKMQFYYNLNRQF